MEMQLCLELLTRLRLAAREDGDRVLGLWEREFGDCLPDRYNNWEPINRPFDLSKRAEILDAWEWPFLARRRKPRMEASIWMRRDDRPLHALWFIDVHAEPAKAGGAILRFIQAATDTLQADFASCTALTDAEIANGRVNHTVEYLDSAHTKPGFAIFSQHLQQCIPDLYWLTVLGEPYLRLFGRARLLSAPVFRAEPVGDRAVSLQLTASLSDMVEDPDGFAQVRRRVKAHLGENAFFSPDRPVEQCLRPEFVWE